MQLNIQVVSDTSETHLVLKPDELESAIARPQTLHYYDACNDLFALGVRLMVGISQNHPFMQGNKRTAFHAAITFMELNDLFLDVSDKEENAKWVVELETGVIDESAVVEALRKRVMG